MTTPALRYSRILLLLLALLGALGLTACVHRINIQQGNFLQPKDIERVTVGMTRVQVRALLGTPMVADPFHPSRWDYVYYLKSGRLQRTIRRHFIVFFDEGDKVARIERVGVTPETDSEVADRESLEPEPSATEPAPPTADDLPLDRSRAAAESRADRLR